MEGIKRINIDKEKPMGAVAQIRIDQTRLVMGISIRKIKRGMDGIIMIKRCRNGVTLQRLKDEWMESQRLKDGWMESQRLKDGLMELHCKD